MSPNAPEGFRYQVRQSGDVEILHFGRPAAILRADDARKFLAKVELVDELALQHLMARVTGNYKRGNESAAAQHGRNR